MDMTIKARLQNFLWHSQPSTSSQALGLTIARHTAVIVRDLMDGQLSMRAMSMVYTTLLSLVPILALGFSMLKALGVHNSLEPVLLNLLSPLGPQAGELVTNIISFVENIKVGLLGSVGVGLLLFAAISMIQKVEGSFNFIWQIERARGIGQRFSEYLAVLTVGPLAVFIAMGVTASIFNSDLVARISEVEPFGWMVSIASRLIPYALIISLFCFLYMFIPNTRVRFRAALAGGVLAGFLWQSASLAFASFVAGATNYNAIYSGFAIIIFLLIWLYVGWLIMLIGCQLAFYVQHPEHLTPNKQAPLLGARRAEYLGLSAMAEIGQRFMAGKPPMSAEELTRKLKAAPEHVDRVLDVLLHHKILATTGADQQSFLPSRDLDSLTVAELWRLLRAGFDVESVSDKAERACPMAHQVIETAEADFDKGLDGRSVRQWLQQKHG